MSINSIGSVNAMYISPMQKHQELAVVNQQDDSSFSVKNNSKLDTSISKGTLDFLSVISEVQISAVEKSNTDFVVDISDQALNELDKLFTQMDKIFETAGDTPLSAEQEKQLSALDKKIEGLLGASEEMFDPFLELSENASTELDELFKQMDKIFETVGDGPLSDEQKKQLSALEEKLANLFQ